MARGFGSRILDSGSYQLRRKLGGESSRQRKRNPFLTLWPNGQFSLSYKFRTDAEATSEVDEWKYVHGGVIRGAKRSVPDPNLVSTVKFSQTGSRGGRKSAKYGLKGISRLGVKMVRSSAYLLQRKYGRKGLTFLTLTVPSLSAHERRAVALAWGDIMRQTMQRLSRLLVRSQQPPLAIAVTELQSSRLKRTGKAYLHVHAVLPSRHRCGRHWVVEVSSFRLWWKRLLESKIGRELERLPRVETKVVRKSVEGYLGKYMTKGNESMQGIVEDLGEDCVPGQQWHTTKPMRDWVRAATVASWNYGDLMQYKVDLHVAGVDEIKAYLSRIEINIGGRILTTAWVGNLSESERFRLGLPPPE